MYKARLVPGEPRIGAQLSDIADDWGHVERLLSSQSANNANLAGWSRKLQAPAVVFCQGIEFAQAFIGAMQVEKAWSMWKNKKEFEGDSSSGVVDQQQLLDESIEWCSNFIESDGTLSKDFKERLSASGWTNGMLLGDTARLVLVHSDESVE